MSEPTELLTVEETDGGMHLVRLVPSTAQMALPAIMEEYRDAVSAAASLDQESCLVVDVEKLIGHTVPTGARQESSV